MNERDEFKLKLNVDIEELIRVETKDEAYLKAEQIVDEVYLAVKRVLSDSSDIDVKIEEIDYN